MNLIKLQDEMHEWREKNFPDSYAGHQLLGVVEEVGELCHAVLKLEQGIRGDEKELMRDERDAIGDIAIYLMQYCAERGYCFEKILGTTWDQVKQRDWKKYPTTGKPGNPVAAPSAEAKEIMDAAIGYVKAEINADAVCDSGLDELLPSSEETLAVDEMWRQHERLMDVVSKYI